MDHLADFDVEERSLALMWDATMEQNGRRSRNGTTIYAPCPSLRQAVEYCGVGGREKIAEVARSERGAVTMPLDLTIDNYAQNEKVAYLPRKLTEEGAGSFDNEQAGDLCYFAPWGNLALFYAGYRWSSGLIRLGRFEDGHEPLLARGEFQLRIERD